LANIVSVGQKSINLSVMERAACTGQLSEAGAFVVECHRISVERAVHRCGGASPSARVHHPCVRPPTTNYASTSGRTRSAAEMTVSAPAVPAPRPTPQRSSTSRRAWRSPDAAAKFLEGDRACQLRVRSRARAHEYANEPASGSIYSGRPTRHVQNNCDGELEEETLSCTR